LALNLVSNSSKVNKSKDKSSKSKGSQKKTSDKNKDLNKDSKEKTVQSVKYEPQIDDGTYRATEYYKHNNWSFYDYMINMKKYRLPVPSNQS
jgi:hypothetical protein